jgi:hypothetical protein
VASHSSTPALDFRLVLKLAAVGAGIPIVLHLLFYGAGFYEVPTAFITSLVQPGLSMVLVGIGFFFVLTRRKLRHGMDIGFLGGVTYGVLAALVAGLLYTGYDAFFYYAIDDELRYYKAKSQLYEMEKVQETGMLSQMPDEARKEEYRKRLEKQREYVAKMKDRGFVFREYLKKNGLTFLLLGLLFGAVVGLILKFSGQGT